MASNPNNSSMSWKNGQESKFECSPLKGQSSRKKVAICCWYSERSWKMEHFCFYRMFWIVVVFEIIAFEILNLLQALRCNTQTFLNFCGKIDFCIVFLYFYSNKLTQKLSNLKIVLGYWNENPDSCFRFNNPKQLSNWIIFMSFCSSHLAIKNCYNVPFMKI